MSDDYVRQYLREAQTVLDGFPGQPGKVELRGCLDALQGMLFGQAEVGIRVNGRGPRESEPQRELEAAE